MTSNPDRESRKTERRDAAQKHKMKQAPPPLDPKKIHNDPPNAGGQRRDSGGRDSD